VTAPPSTSSRLSGDRSNARTGTTGLPERNGSQTTPPTSATTRATQAGSAMSTLTHPISHADAASGSNRSAVAKSAPTPGSTSSFRSTSIQSSRANGYGATTRPGYHSASHLASGRVMRGHLASGHVVSGASRHVTSGLRGRGHDSARHGSARHGSARHDSARHGGGGHDSARHDGGGHGGGGGKK
jgi:hypothetical protein